MENKMLIVTRHARLIVPIVASGAFIIVLMSTDASGQDQRTGQDQIKAVLEQLSKIDLKLKPTSHQDVIDTTDAEVHQFTSPNIAGAINETGAVAFFNQLLKSQTTFQNPQVKFSDQTAKASMNFAGPLSLGPLGTVDVTAKLNADLAPAVEVVSDRAIAEFKVSFAVTKLDTQILSIARNRRPLPGLVNEIAEAVANGVLVPAQAALNRLELRLPTTISAKIDLKSSQRPGVVTSFEPNKLVPKLQITALAYLLNNGRLTVVAQEGSSKKPAPNAKNVSFDSLRSDFKTLLTSTGSSWIEQGDFSAYAQGAFIERIASQLLNAGPICMQSTLRNLPIPFETKLKLPSEDAIDCTPTKDCAPTRDCTPTRNCDVAQDCTPHRNCDAVKDCGGYKWYQGPDKARCEIEKKAAKVDCERLKSTEKATCELNKATRKADCERLKSQEKAQCETEKTGEKAACEALKTTEKGACESFKESYKRFRATGSDYANVDSDDLVLSGYARVCLNSISFLSNNMELKAKMVAQAQAKASGHVKFTPLNVAGHLTCFAPFRKELNVDANVPVQTIDVDTTASFFDDNSRVAIQASVASPIHIQFPFATVAAKLATDPAFAIECPIAHTATVIRVATPDKWWPPKARGDIDRDVPPLNLDLDLVRKPIQVGDLKVTGKLMHNENGVGGTFSLSK
jgi:hypothetical protein